MKITIMDDNNTHLEMLKTQLNSTDNNNITCFYNAETLIRYLESNHTDVLFLDIDLGYKKNGIELAEEFLLKYPEMMIIYVTSYNDRFSQEIFMRNSNLCGYLVKPVEIDKLNTLLMKVKLRISERKNNYVIIKHQNKLCNVLIDDIIYAESKNHYIYVHTNVDTYCFNGKLSEFVSRLSEIFIYPHKSFVVNVNFIRHIEQNCITLCNDIIVPISRSRYNDFKKEYLKLMSDILFRGVQL